MINGRKNATRNPWTSKEISALKSYFKNNMSSLTVPGKAVAKDPQRKCAVLKARPWRVVKAKVHNLTVNQRKKK